MSHEQSFKMDDYNCEITCIVPFQEERLVTFQAWDLYHGVVPKTVKGFKKVEYGYLSLSLDLLDLKNMQSQSLLAIVMLFMLFDIILIIIMTRS